VGGGGGRESTGGGSLKKSINLCQKTDLYEMQVTVYILTFFHNCVKFLYPLIFQVDTINVQLNFFVFNPLPEGPFCPPLSGGPRSDWT
jgi:hypothetical protein